MCLCGPYCAGFLAMTDMSYVAYIAQYLAICQREQLQTIIYRKPLNDLSETFVNSYSQECDIIKLESALSRLEKISDHDYIYM
jgi:hypothetical protein